MLWQVPRYQLCDASCVYCCFSSSHAPSTQCQTSPEDGNEAGLMLPVGTEGQCLVPRFPLPMPSSSLLLPSWLGAGLLAGGQRDVLWGQLLASSVPELPITRSPGTFSSEHSPDCSHTPFCPLLAISVVSRVRRRSVWFGFI